MARPTSATIHADALRHNLAEIRRRAPARRVMAVVKADGYGHGLERTARALAGADAFGVGRAGRCRAPARGRPVAAGGVAVGGSMRPTTCRNWRD